MGRAKARPLCQTLGVMPLKPSIYLAINAGSINKHIAKRAQPLVYKPTLAGDKVIDLITFPYASSAVVTYAAVKKALLKLENSDNHKVFLGWDFTIEARELLSKTDVTLLEKQNFGWSDDSWFSIKNI